jgi:hypothetical protein
MPAAKNAAFVINLVQDVNILRPLIFMASRDFGMDSLLLVSRKFTARDLFGIWQSELEDICEETGARLELFADDWEAHRQLTGEGVIFAASESHLHNHVTTHSIFQHAPHGFVRVTIQHGFECVGFRHSADHTRAHGHTASFGADYVCSWFPPDRLQSVAPSQVGKILVTGPTAVLQSPERQERRGSEPGIVCENLHSVRLNGAGDFKIEFVDAFSEFCRQLGQERMEVTLRPHPGGQYVLKNKIPLPPNASVNNAPIYRLDLSRFAYGISAPSSVLIDMVLAGIPTAVWSDRRGDMDSDNYAGLTTISTPSEWVEFARSATSDPAPFLTLQAEFLDRQGMILDPSEVYLRYAAIFQSVLRTHIRPTAALAERERILFVAPANVPTLQLSFQKPLRPLVDRGEFTTSLLTEEMIRLESARVGDNDRLAEWVDRYLDRFSPSMLVFCRYSGPMFRRMVAWARRQAVPVLYHIDDDLLAIPPDIGASKHALHNSPGRLTAVRELLNCADLVYASTEKLRLKLLEYFPDIPVVAGRVYCSSAVVRRPRPGPATKVGYMASADHAHNLGMILPAIEQMLERNPAIRFELLGSIPVPPSLERFGDRISAAPPIADYDAFLSGLAALRWDVGICPLAPIEFNLMKADTKWVEYTAAGAAVVASGATVYDDCCSGGCGILADGTAEWLEGLELLIGSERERIGMVERSQAKLESEYSVTRLREQVLEMLEMARSNARGRAKPKQKRLVVAG